MGFNLCTDPWVPIAGRAKRMSLTELFSGPSPGRLAGNAVDKIVILRFLLALVHAANRIEDLDAWVALAPEIMAANVRTYLEGHHDCFELYGDRPFLQFSKLAELGGQASSPGSLLVDVAVGNKVVLSGWNREKSLSNAEKTILLLRSSCFACGGKKFDKELCLSPGVIKGATGSSGTLLGFLGFLHAYMLGDNLWETLRLNLLTERNLREVNAWPQGVGKPFWEEMPGGETDARAEQYKHSYQGQLFPLDKFLLLTDEGVIKTSGITYPGHKNGLIDPALTIIADGKDIRATWARTEDRPWRQLPALLKFLESRSHAQPYFLSMGMEKLRRLDAGSCTVWVGGVAVSSNSGEQYLSGTNDYVESEFSIDTAYMFANSYHTFTGLMEKLEKMAKRLFGSVFNYFTKTAGQDNAADFAARAKSVFWERMEPHAQEIITLAFSETDENTLGRATGKWFDLLCRIYEEFCPRDTPRQLTAWVEAHPGFQTITKKGDR
ncbi:MAG: type I-E CRISPR-associated protein Cse1/CasA [Lentisphaeria bacterium]|nr:type I-E CRISPR-associated protein Cse1/CasA [Lentisphaeria bacterium]